MTKTTAISRLYDNLDDISGYQDITYALQSNFTMKHIPFPTFDLQSAIKTSPERVDAIIRRMQDALQRNSNPSSFGGRNQNFRLTQGDRRAWEPESLYIYFLLFQDSCCLPPSRSWTDGLPRSRTRCTPWRKITSKLDISLRHFSWNKLEQMQVNKRWLTFI